MHHCHFSRVDRVGIDQVYRNIPNGSRPSGNEPALVTSLRLLLKMTKLHNIIFYFKKNIDICVHVLLKAVIFRSILIRKTIIKCILLDEQEMPILITQTILKNNGNKLQVSKCLFRVLLSNLVRKKKEMPKSVVKQIIYNFPSYIRSIILLAITIFFICRQFGIRQTGNRQFGMLPFVYPNYGM